MIPQIGRNKLWIVAGMVVLALVCLVVGFGCSMSNTPTKQVGATNTGTDTTASRTESSRASQSDVNKLTDDVSELSRQTTEFGEVDTRYEQTELFTCAQSILQTYQARQDCVLAQVGYLDLCGKVWSCTTCGKGWVDIVFVSQKQNDQCEVKTVHLTAQQWASRYANPTTAA